MGSSDASATCLRAIMRDGELEVVGVVTQPDRPAGRGKALTPCPCKAFAVQHGIVDVITPEDVNSEESMAQIRAWRPDVVAVVAFGQILKKPLLDLPPNGWRAESADKAVVSFNGLENGVRVKYARSPEYNWRKGHD